MHRASPSFTCAAQEMAKSVGRRVHRSVEEAASQTNVIVRDNGVGGRDGRNGVRPFVMAPSMEDGQRNA
jgi:hypothetical protein